MRKPKNYWTRENCKEAALTCKTKKEFAKKYPGAYDKSLKYGINEICSHMKISDNMGKKIIYSYEFNNNYVYVGMTCNLKIRNYQHLGLIAEKKKSSVYEYIKKTKAIPELKTLTDYVEFNKAKKLEQEYIDLYKNNGWILLNKIKGGSLGAINSVLTVEKCKEAALTCKTKTEFAKKYPGAYKKSLEYGINEICSHMIFLKKPNGYWTREKCKEAALTCKTKREFAKKYSTAYKKSLKYGINEICSHMISKIKPKNTNNQLNIF